MSGKWEYAVAMLGRSGQLIDVVAVARSLEYLIGYKERCNEAWGDGTHVIVRRRVVVVPDWEIMDGEV